MTAKKTPTEKTITEDDVEYGEAIHTGPQTPNGVSL